MKKTVLSFALMLLCLCGVLTMQAQDRVNFSFDFEDNAIPSFFTNNAATNTGATNKFWSVVSGSNYGTYCMRSGNAATASSTTSISTTIEFASAGTISFDALCEGEGTGDHYYDKCIFSIDGTEQFRYGAQVSGWQHYSYNVASGTHTFTWSYQKDGSVDPTGDGFSVDNVAFTNVVQPTVNLNLRKAAITINSSNQLATGCYKWDNSTSAWYVTKTAESIDFNSVYEVGMWLDAEAPNATIGAVTLENGGTVDIKNRNESDLTALSEWDARANSVRANNKGTYNLTLNHHDGELKLRLNNIRCTGYDDFTFAPTASTTGNESNTKLHIYLKGDNRMYRMRMNNANNAFDACQVIIESDSGGTGTLALGTRSKDTNPDSNNNNQNSHNRNCGIIGSENGQNSMDIHINSGVIYAGSCSWDYCNAIGAGNGCDGFVTITGQNTIVTACTYSLGASIGGGGSGTASRIGAGGSVSITNGATVYAYNLGYSTTYIGATAIGGGSSVGECHDQTVTISNSTVYAESKYGPAIGGGTQRSGAGNNYTPGSLTCSITNSTVTARGSWGRTVTLDSYYTCAQFPSIGGGTTTSTANTHNGGNLNLTITNSTVTAGSIGSGKAAHTSYNAGTTNVTVTGNSTLNGTQVVILPTSSSQGTNSFTMTGGSITDRDNTNYAYTHYHGGALYINNNYTTASLTNVTVTSSTGRGKDTSNKICFTGHGGAIYCNSSSSASTSLTLSGCTFDECSTLRYKEGPLTNYTEDYGDGGAIYNDYGSFSISNCVFTDCECGDYGSALYLYQVQNTVNMTNCDFSGCTSSSGNAHTLYTYRTTATLDSNSSFTNCQGALYASSGSHITLNDCPVSSCTGASYGGAIYATGTSTYWTDVRLNSVNITNCTSTSHGGAIYFTGTWSDLYVNGGRIENCHSTGTGTGNSGGALYLTCSNANYPSTYNFSNALIKDCYSGGQGGAIYITGTGQLTMNGGSIQNCYTTTTSSSYGKGGAIFVDGTSSSSKDFSINLNNLTISGCHTNSKGGAIYKEGYNGDINLNNTTITNCSVTTTDATNSNYHGGGGIYLMQGGAINLNNGTTISECTAPNGGGVYVYRNTSSTTSNRGTINMTAGATIENCEATGSTANGYGYGGGVYYDYYSYNSATLSGTITGCSAMNGGGVAIYSNSSPAYPGQIILDGSVYDCEASGLGGGVYIHSKGKLYLTGGDITTNTATTNGGGIYKLGTLMVSGSPIVKGNSVSGTANNVYIPTTAAEDFIYVDNVINPDGIDCGASIGVSKLSSEHTYIDGDYTNITNSGYVSGISTSNLVPFNATKANCFQKCEFIIPASALTDLVGKTISTITFHTSEASASFGTAIRFTGFMKTTTASTLSGFEFATDSNVVMSATALSVSNNTLTLTLSSPFTYSDGTKNLHFGLWITTKGSAYSDGVNFEGFPLGGACVSASEATTTSTTLANVAAVQRNFVPRMTITTSDSNTWELTQDKLDCTGEITSNCVPICAEKANYVNKCEFIIPSSILQDMGGEKISSITFYTEEASATFGAAVFKLFLESTSNSSITAYSFVNNTSTEYYNGSLTVSGNQMTINLSSNYTYSNSSLNLHIGLWETTKGSAVSGGVHFKGYAVTGASVASESTTTTLSSVPCFQRNFLPKMTITTVSGKVWEYPNNPNIMVQNSSSTLRNRAFFDDTQTCGVYNSPVAPSYFDASSNTLYLVKHTTTNNDFYLDASAAVAGTDYTLSNDYVSSILTAKGLAYLSIDVEGGKDYAGRTVTLENDLDLSSYQWEPIGYSTECGGSSSAFAGTFDGQGHHITGLICQYDYPSLGLFGCVSGTVQNLYVMSGTLGGASNNTTMGGIVGNLVGGSVINCESAVTMTGGPDAIMGGIVGKTPTLPETETVGDQSANNQYVPTYGWYAETYQKCEYIIPAASLASLNGKELASMTYYLHTPASGSWGAARYQIFLKEVSGTTLSAFEGTTGATTVYTGPLDASQSTMYIGFNTTFHYNGGNLLVGIYEIEPGTYAAATFYGTASTGACVQGYSSTSLAAVTATQQNFIPKTTFATESDVTNDINNGIEITPSTIASCTALPTMTGRTMGGVVGRLSSGTVSNSFANPHFTYTGSTEYVGGIAGISQGNVVNCYTRQRSNLSSNYGWIVGGNAGSVSYCYIPQGNNNYVANGNAASNSGTYAPAETPYLYMHNDMRLTLNGSLSNEHLIDKLNTWATDHESTAWIRTSASPINGDHPILRYESSDCVASTDNIVLNYSDDFDGLLNAQTSGTILLYGNAGNPSSPITHGNNSNVEVYIDEDATLYHTSTITNAHVGITLKNADWHMFSPSISNAPLGVNYVKTDGTTPDDTNYPFTTGHPTGMPYYQFFPETTQDGYFPSRTYGTTYVNNNSGPTTGGNYYEGWDYYTYFEPQYHWINFKRNGNSHHHEDSYNENIVYQYYNGTNYTVGNEPYLIRGKGYLLGIKQETLLQSRGTLNQGTFTIPLTHDGAYRTGYNFIGNPYQSYFDFNTFAEDNTFIWGGTANACYIMLYDGAYHVYEYNSSANQYAAPRLLHPHQGFMVITRAAGNAQFNNGQRIVSDDANAPFRNLEQPNYTLVNLIVTDDEEKQDIVTVELDRPDEGGAYKQYDLHYGKGCIYAHYEDRDYSVAFTQPGVGVVPIRFEASEDATFTLTWDIENGSIPYVHLIDNITGIDINCLTDTVYRFTSTTNDYKSRFKLVFQYTGINEPDDNDDENGAQTFAFFMGHELVVNGDGFLQLFDVNGRLLGSHDLVGQQNTVRLPNLAAGVYMLRLTNREGTQTQKIIIQH